VQKNLYQGDTYLTRSFHDKFYIVSMGMNTRFRVDSHFFNAIPFIHFSTSTKLSCWNLSGITPVEYDAYKVWVIQIRGNIGLTHRAF